MAVNIRKLVSIDPRFSDKPQAVKDYFYWNFIRRVAKNVNIVSASFQIVVLEGVDASPNNLLSGSASVEPDGKTVRQLLQNGVAGVLYEITCTATTDEEEDNTREFVTQLKVV